MRTFLELFPYRIEQAIGWMALRRWRVRRGRNKTTLARPHPDERPRLFIDMAVISNHDAGTGIQRVVRALALAVLAEAPQQWDVRFVSARRKRRYFEIAWPVSAPDNPIGPEMTGRPGDVFIGLDYSLDAVRRHRRQLARFGKNGGTLWFLVHDLLPLNQPKWFSRNTVIRYGAWLDVIARVADGFLCNSAHTEAELRDALKRVYGLQDGYHTQVLPMGHSILEAPDAIEIYPMRPRFEIASQTTTPFMLMVGTLEPRKGHADIIAAFDELWRQGWTQRLVLVGRLGWKVEPLHDLIINHPEFGGRLLWFDDVADAELLAIYEACAGVIIASLAEGFGLPLIEALGHGRPVLARDLAVFRIHDGKGVRFFPEHASAAQIASSILLWLEEIESGTISVSRPADNWAQSARIMLKSIESTSF